MVDTSLGPASVTEIVLVVVDAWLSQLEPAAAAEIDKNVTNYVYKANKSLSFPHYFSLKLLCKSFPHYFSLKCSPDNNS